MQKLLLTGALCLLMNGLSAQPWMKQFEGQSRIKLQDVVNARQAEPKAQDADNEEEEEGPRMPKGVVKEGKDYHFDRWRWYWEQHLDEEGYMVSPIKNYQELDAYRNRTNGNAGNSGKYAKMTASSSNWSFQGPITSPANGRGLGRIQKITFHPTDSNSFWVGTAGGGAWKTINGGLNWTCMTDMLPVLGIADVTFNPLNPAVIYLCTGDRDALDNSSLGVLKSTDGGVTWNLTGFQFARLDVKRTNSLLVNPIDTAALLLTTSDGIYQSRNSGASWTLRAGGSFRELMYKPGGDTAVVYATSGAYIGSAQIYRSADGGASWTKVTSVSGNPSRVSIAVSASAPNVVKAIFANAGYGLEGIYQSTDTGKTYTKIFDPSGSCSLNYLANSPIPSSSTCDGQGWYDLSIAVSPTDVNKVVIGGVNTWYSINGGTSWQLANQWTNYVPGTKTVHADKHYMAYQPLRPTTLFECNDGGLYKTTNPVSTVWTDLTNGMGITQFYRMSVADYSQSAIGGAQDNGSKLINPGYPTTELTGGDGMNCELDPIDPNTYYTAIQYGDIYRNSVTRISDNIPGQPTGDWITPYALHPRAGSRIVAGYDKMYLSYDQGDNWSEISPVFSSQKIKRVAFAMSNLNTIYALAGNTVRRTIDNGVNWTSVLGAPGGTISDIIVDKKDKQHIWVTYSGYGTNKVAEYDSTNGGWKALNDSLPNVPVNCILIDTSNSNIYIGTDIGVFYRTPAMTTWTAWSTNLPSAEVTDMGINYKYGELWASTYGRGFWKTAKADAIPTGVSVVPYATDIITVSPNPANGIFDIQTSNAALVGQPASVKVIDLTGRIVWSAQHSFSSGGVLHVDAQGLPRATYVVDVTTGNGMMARTKLVIY